MVNQSDIMSYITEVERFIKYFEKSWKKDVKTTNAEIMGSLPFTRSNDARIRKMITNTESILTQYANDLIDKLNRLDQMGQEYRQGIVEDNIVLSIYDVILSIIDALHMEYTLVFPKETQVIKYSIPTTVTDTKNRWQRYRNNLPTIKIQKIETELLQCQESLESLNVTKNALKQEEDEIQSKISISKGILEKKKLAFDEAIIIEEEYKKQLFYIRFDMNRKITLLEEDIQRLQAEKSSYDIDKAKRNLSRASEMYDSKIVVAQEKIEQLTALLQQQNAEEALATEKVEKAFLFKKKKQEIVSELSAKANDTRIKLDAAIAELENYKSQKETTVSALEAKVSDLQSKLDDIDNQISILTENKQEAEKQIKQAEQDFDAKTLKKNVAEKEYEEAKKVLSTLEKELKKNGKALSAADSEIQTLSSAIEEYYQEIAKIKESADATRKKIERKLQKQAEDEVAAKAAEEITTVLPEVAIEEEVLAEPMQPSTSNSDSIDVESPEMRSRLQDFFTRIDEIYPNRVVIGLLSSHPTLNNQATKLYRDLGYTDLQSFLSSYGYGIKDDNTSFNNNEIPDSVEDDDGLAKPQVEESIEAFVPANGYAPKGSSIRSDDAKAAALQRRLTNLFAKLDEAYPDKVIYGLYRDHKKWGETVTELYRALGYESSTEFLNAYGYKVRVAEPKNSVGRTKTVLGDEIIAELQRRYPNGSEYTKADDLFAANPDLETKKKTLANQANEMFGMPLGKYLISIGLIQCKIQPKEEDTFDYEGYLKEFADEVKKRLVGVDFIPDSTSKLPDSFANMDFQLARRCVKKVYGDAKTLDTYLQEVGALRTPLDENAEMLYCVDILKARYKKSKKLPTKLRELASENPDLPIRNLNKYIREVIGEKKTENYYIRNRILQGKDTDLLEYVFCQVKVPQENHPYYYISKVEDLKVGDKVVVKFGWHGKIIGTVHSIKTCIGLDAPWPVSQTENILRKAHEEEINNNIVNWTDEDKWLYQWQEDDANEEYASKNIPEYPPLISIKTYMEGKKNLVDFIQHQQAINSIYHSNIYDKTQLPSFLFDNVGLQGGTYLEDERLYAVMSRVHNTSNQTSVQIIEQLKEGDILLGKCNFSTAIYIKSQSNVTIGHISNDISDVLLPMLIKKYASIKEVKVSYVRPLSKMVPKKKHPALYVILVIELADMTKNLTEGSCVALYGYDWKANAEKVSFLTTTIPLDAAKILFYCGKRYSGVRPFERFCQDCLGSYSKEYKAIEPYITSEMHYPDYYSLYELFYKYAVDETTLYSLEGEIVPFATWDANTGGGFNHWCEKIVLNDIACADWEIGIDEIVLSEG